MRLDHPDVPDFKTHHLMPRRHWQAGQSCHEHAYAKAGHRRIERNDRWLWLSVFNSNDVTISAALLIFAILALVIVLIPSVSKTREEAFRE